MSDDYPNLTDLVKKLLAATKDEREKEVLLFSGFARNYLCLKLVNPTLRPATKKSFDIQVTRHLIPAFGHLNIRELGNTQWLAWVSEMRAKDPEVQFFNARKYLTEIMSAAKEQGRIEKIPKFDDPDSSKDVGRALSDPEVLKILKHTRNSSMRFFFTCFGKWAAAPKRCCVGNGP